MLKSAFLLLIIGCLVLAAAPASIGIVKSTGEFRVNGSAVPGNSTLFDGDVIETASVRSVVQLGSTQVTLLPQSRAHIFRDRTVLEKGSGLMVGAPIHVEAATLSIAPSARSSVVQVDIFAPDHVSVATRDGGAEVRNSSGVLVANVRSGSALSFDLQSGASTAVKMTGTVVAQSAKYYLTDACANVKIELRGANLDRFVGKQADVTGSAIPGAIASGGASQVVQAVTITPVKGKADPCAAGVAGATVIGPAGNNWTPHGSTAAIFGSLGVAGAVLGVSAAHSCCCCCCCFSRP